MLSGERAVGLVEILVASFILLIVLSLFISTFLQAFVRTSDNDATSMSSARVTEALDRLGDDLRSARVAMRGDISRVSTRDDLRTRLTEDPVGNGDLAHATGRQLAVWTDSESDPAGPRCATWGLETVIDDVTVWALVRRSGPPGGACPAAASEPREVVALLGAAAPSRDVFRYRVLQPVAGTGRCDLNDVAPGTTPLNATTRLRVMAVDADLASMATRRSSRGVSNGRASIDLWARLNNDYYYAIGCNE
jgi:hypothetical protein